MYCEMCGYHARSYWRQRVPVQRDICNPCAKLDRAASVRWEGEFIPWNMPVGLDDGECAQEETR